MKKLNLAALIVVSALICASIVFYVLMGIYDLSSRIVFFAAFISIIFYLALNYKALPAFFRKSGMLTGINKTFQVILLFGILIFVYLLSGMFPLKIDLTASRLYSLTSETVNLLNRLSNDINIYYFKQQDKSDMVLDYEDNLLKIYTERCGHLNLSIVDPNRNKSLANRYNVSENGTVVFDYKGNTSTVSLKKVVSSDQETGRINYMGEAAYTLAIKSVIAGRPPNVYILQGHGEINPAMTDERGYSGMAGILKEQNMNVKVLNLMSFPDIPADCGLLIIGNPTHSFTADELDKIDNFVNQGGSVLVMLELETHLTVNDILRQMGLYYYRNLVVEDQDYIPQYGRTTVIINNPVPHMITMPLIRNHLGIVMPTSCGILEIPEKDRLNKDDLTLAPLLKTSANSFGEVSLKKIKSGFASQDKEDMQGPLVLGYAAKKVHFDISESRKGEITNRNESRMIVFGDSDFINNSYISTGGNSDLFLNSVNYLLNREGEISIRPKSTAITGFQLSSFEQRLLFVISIAVFLLYILPGIIIVIGRMRRVKS